MTRAKIREAVPPAYAEFIGREALRQDGTMPMRSRSHGAQAWPNA